MEAEITLTVKFGPRVTPENIEYIIKKAVEWVEWMSEVEEAKLVERIIKED